MITRARQVKVKDRTRGRLAAYRKERLTAAGHVYNDLARLANVTYSMADKWMNGRRASVVCARAFVTLTGAPAVPEKAA